MSLSQTELKLVTQSLKQAENLARPGSTVFYTHLFSHAPELKSMFRDDLAGQGMKFMSTLVTITEALAGEDETDFIDLAQGHAAIGIKPEHFAPMLEALMDTFRQTLGDDFTVEAESAWRIAFAAISARMIKLGATG